MFAYHRPWRRLARGGPPGEIACARLESRWANRAPPCDTLAHVAAGVNVLDEPEYIRWRETADSSLRAASLLADAGEHHHACLHAEQAAQQSVKALLHAVGTGGRARGHHLTELGRGAAAASGCDLPEGVRDALTRLARHYLPSRYPDALPGGTPAEHYRSADSTQALADARAVIAFVESAHASLVVAGRRDADDPEWPDGTQDGGVNPHDIITVRGAERERLLQCARAFAARLDAALRVRAVVVFGSVARGDFNQWSDVDVLVVAEDVPTRAPDRFAALGESPDPVAAVAWTPGEWRAARQRSNPIAVEALTHGVWLLGTPDMLERTW
jgi:HEPN domain-containing protein